MDARISDPRSGISAADEEVSAAPVPDEPRPRIFLSYSRKDLVMAERLRDLLGERGFDAYLDMHDIMPGEPWRERLAGLIQSAEKVVFLISPDAVVSPVCGWEVDHAEKLGKSVLPAIVRQTDMAAIPGRLQRLHATFLRNGDEIARSLDGLVASLNVDLAWEREKTRINDAALAWEAAERPRRLLLFAEDAIRHAEAWRDRAPASAPPPTPLQLAFIAESRRHRTRRQRRTLAAAVAVSIVTAAAAVVAVVQRGVAVESAKQAEQRSATMSLNLAGTLADAGETDAALLMALDAARSFEGGETPDTLVASFGRVLARAAREASYMVPRDTVPADARGGLLLHAPSAATARFFSPSDGFADLGAMHGSMIGSAETLAPPGNVYVTMDGSHVRVYSLADPGRDLRLAAEFDAGVSAGQVYVDIAGDGLTLVAIPSPEGPSRDFLVDANRGLVSRLDGGVGAWRVVSDSTGDRFLLTSEYGVHAIGQDLSLGAAEGQDAAELMRQKCLGPDLLRDDAAQALSALREIDGEVYAYIDAICRTTGDALLHSWTQGTSAGGKLQTAVYDLFDGQAEPFLTITTTGSLIPASWAVGDELRAVAIPDYQRVTVYHDFVQPGEALSLPSRVVLHKLFDDGTLLVFREAVSGTGLGDAQPLLSVLSPGKPVAAFAERPEAGNAPDYSAADPRLFLKPMFCGAETARTIALASMQLVLPPSGPPTGEGTLGAVPYELGLLDTSGTMTGTLAFAPVHEGPCIRLSPDLRWMAVPDRDGFRIYDVSGAAPVLATTIGRNPDDWAGFDFLGGGPSLVLATGGKVYSWAPDGGGPWRQTLLYSGADHVYDVESDAEGRRLLLNRDLGEGTREGIVYSLETRQELFSLGTEYKYLTSRFARDGRIFVWKYDTLTDIFAVPDAPSLTAAAAAELSPHCRVPAGESWRASPCWPARFR